MAEASIVQDVSDRFRDAFGSIEDEVERVQRQLRTRRRKLEKQLASNRKDLEKRIDSGRKDFEKRAKKLRTQVQKNPTFKRLEKVRKDAEKRYEEGVETFLKALQIASKSDVQRIDRKISQLNKKLKEMERARAPKKVKAPAATEGQAAS
ncbi:MAG: hypothetical protein ACQGVC_18810 [Myxococcota bacterium]